jgi:hypothetical protein
MKMKNTISEVMNEIETSIGIKLDWARVTNPKCDNRTFEEWVAKCELEKKFPRTPRICAVTGYVEPRFRCPSVLA